MGINERKERDKKEMEELILDAAMKLFLEEGYKNLTIRKIASEIEYSPATIYLYFKDKDEIFFTLQKRAFAKFYEVQMSVQSIPDARERLTAHGWAYIRFALENKEYYDLMFIMSDPVLKMKKIEDWDTGIHSYDLLRKNVRECVEAGVMKSNDVESASFALWSFVHGIASLIIKRGFMIPEEYTNALVGGAMQQIENFFVTN